MEKSKTPQQNGSNDEFLYGLNGLMEWLNISKSTAYKMKKKVPHLQMGKLIRFRKEDVLKVLEKNYQTVE